MDKKQSDIDTYLDKYFDDHEEFDPEKMDKCFSGLEKEKFDSLIDSTDRLIDEVDKILTK